MKLQHIEIENLKLSPLNVRRHGQTKGDDLVPSIRAMGIIQPLLVRPNCQGFEVIAGQRRLDALNQIATDQEVDPVPCLIMDADDDAKAIEASLSENIDRLPMDEMNQYEAFLALTKEGQSIANIASHFGVTEKLVTQRLAISNLYEPIRNAYREDKIEPQAIRLLTMASMKQQKKWFSLFKKDQEPPAWKLKSWLFGGEAIPVENALFDLATYKGAITSNLFDEERYFADIDLFWSHQSQAIAELKLDLEEDGWREIVLLDVGQSWQKYEHVSTPKDQGGKVYIQVRANGEVKVHEGLLPEKEAKRLALSEAGEEAVQTAKPELTKSMQNYLDLHRHAAVRVELLKHQGVALRLCVAQILASTSLWDVRADHQKANTEAIKDSVTASTAQAAFTEEKKRIMDVLGIEGETDEPLVFHQPYYGRGLDVHTLFEKLMTLAEDEILDILAFLIAETLPKGSALIEGIGAFLNLDMATHWQPDETFFALLRDKDAINAILSEVGGKSVAKGNVAATAKVQKGIISDFLNGNGRERVQNWQPRYMAFPMKAYTKKGGIVAIDQFKEIKQHYAA